MPSKWVYSIIESYFSQGGKASQTAFYVMEYPFRINLFDGPCVVVINLTIKYILILLWSKEVFIWKQTVYSHPRPQKPTIKQI